MYKESLEKYKDDYCKIVSADDDKKKIFESSINFLNSRDEDRPAVFYFSKDCYEVINIAINSARQHIDELIDKNEFAEAEKFSQEAQNKIYNIGVFGTNEMAKNQPISETGNFFEVYDYRIIDRKYIYNAKKKIEEIEKKSEDKIYEILTIFVTIVAVIFAFVSGGSVKIYNFEIPSFIFLALTIVLCWLSIKILNSRIN